MVSLREAAALCTNALNDWGIERGACLQKTHEDFTAFTKGFTLPIMPIR